MTRSAPALFLPALLFILGCTGDADPQPGGVAEPAAAAAGRFPAYDVPASSHIQLDRLEGRFQVGGNTLPRSAAETERFKLQHSEMPNKRKAPRKLKVLRAELPFPVSADDQRFRPVGMEVYINGKEIAYERGPAPQATESTWRINGKNLIMSHPRIPRKGAIEVVYPGVRKQLDRHDLATSGLSPEEFVRYEVTLDGHTRHGLMFPAPSTAEWDLKLPDTAPMFETWLAMEPAPLTKPRSDGADVVLTLVADGTEREIARRPLPGRTDGFLQWREDLTPYAGKEVTLRISTAARNNPVFDWVFLGGPAVWGQPSGDIRRVVVLAMDTTRPDHFGINGYERDTTRELDAIGASSVVFDRAWAPAPRTRPSFRTATTGRRPLDAVGARNIGEVFRDNGFATAGIVANVHLQPRFDFHRGFSSWLYDGEADAKLQVDRALEWLGDNRERDTYLFLHFMDPHVVYDAPGAWRDRFVTTADPTLPKRFNRWEVLSWMKEGGISDERKQHIVALHDGELAYMSSEIGRFFDRVDAMPGRTLYVLYSDHGEEFWEHDGFEHNHTLFEEVTRTILWIRPGGGLDQGIRVDASATLADIAPTLYDLFALDDPPSSDGVSLRPFLEGETPADWNRALGIGHLQYAHDRWGVVYDQHKYILHTGSGQEELFNLVSDPGEHTDVAEGTDLAPWRSALAEAHGMEVGPGWRVRVDVPEGTPPIELALPAAALNADVLDPELTVEKRANQEWGEVPKKRPEDIGTVELSDDRRTVVFTPGPAPEGTLYLRFADDVDPAGASLSREGKPLQLASVDGAAAWLGGKVRIEPGTVLVPPVSEAARMRALRGEDAASEQELELLRELGYVHDEG